MKNIVNICTIVGSFILFLLAPVPVVLACGVNELPVPGGCIPYPVQDPNAIFLFRAHTIGSLITFLLPYIFVFSGLAMLLFLIWGGFTLMTSAGDAKAVKSGQQMVTNAIIGFLLVITAFWIVQILQAIFGLTIL
jgi:hypothetical protein